MILKWRHQRMDISTTRRYPFKCVSSNEVCCQPVVIAPGDVMIGWCGLALVLGTGGQDGGEAVRWA